MKRKSIKLGRLLGVLFILALIVLYVIIYVVPKMQGMLEETTVLKYGTLPVTDHTEALIIRDETLFLSDNEGTLDYKISEGEKVRKGTKIVELDPGRVVKRETDADGNTIEPVSEFEKVIKQANEKAKTNSNNTSEVSGVVSYHVDGYEKALTPAKIENLDGKKIEKIDSEVQSVKRATTLKGEPIYKIAKNALWYMVIWKDRNEDIQNYEDNVRVKVNVSDEAQIEAKVSDIYEKDDGYLIVIVTDMYYKDYSKYRKIDISVVFAEYQGLIVDNNSIMTDNDKCEVYVKQKDESYVPVPINIIATSGEYSVLSVKQYYDEDGNEVKTVNYYEEILTNPGEYKKKNG